jgi:hypothetical protein
MAKNHYRNATIPEMQANLAEMRRAIEKPDNQLAPIGAIALFPLFDALDRLCDEVTALHATQSAEAPSTAEQTEPARKPA